MMNDMIKSSLTYLGVVPKPKESSKVSVESSEDEDTSHQGDPEIDQLLAEAEEQQLLKAEEQQDFDSFASLIITLPRGKTPLWKVSQENPQVYPRAQPLVSQPQEPAQAQSTSRGQPHTQALPHAQPSIVNTKPASGSSTSLTGSGSSTSGTSACARSTS